METAIAAAIASGKRTRGQRATRATRVAIATAVDGLDADAVGRALQDRRAGPRRSQGDLVGRPALWVDGPSTSASDGSRGASATRRRRWLTTVRQRQERGPARTPKPAESATDRRPCVGAEAAAGATVTGARRGDERGPAAVRAAQQERAHGAGSRMSRAGSRSREACVLSRPGDSATQPAPVAHATIAHHGEAPEHESSRRGNPAGGRDDEACADPSAMARTGSQPGPRPRATPRRRFTRPRSRATPIAARARDARRR